MEGRCSAEWPTDGPHFTMHGDGSVVVDRWTDTLIVSGELLRNHGPMIEWDGEVRLVITVSNGGGQYRAIGRDQDRDEVLFELVEVA